jgi:hypothetical protein
MCIMDTRLFHVAFGSLMALVLAGTYVLGDDAWMSYLLFVPALLIFLGLRAVTTEEESVGQGRAAGRGTLDRGRAVRLGLALVGVSVLVAVSVEALGLGDLTMWIVAVPAMVLVTLFDREYFGWTDPDDCSAGRRHSFSE